MERECTEKEIQSNDKEWKGNAREKRYRVMTRNEDRNV